LIIFSIEHTLSPLNRKQVSFIFLYLEYQFNVKSRNWLIVWISLFIICGIAQNALSQYSIKGKLYDSTHKYSAVTLEYVPSIRGLSSSVMGNIINRTEIDSNGYFYIAGNTLPKEKRLYRLSLLKENRGASISDGLRKNYILLELNNESQIELSKCDDVSNTFANCSLKGNVESQAIQDFYDLVRQSFLDGLYEMQKDKTALKEQFLNCFCPY